VCAVNQLQPQPPMSYISTGIANHENMTCAQLFE
jgi:hypothetical protein